ncbi:MAG: trypsin-like peptidase domain-containing protein [Deltaproteobacteria bacterium]|nr:trypsin-like peptidase domain-containing protein [Deltaproteobacteria bacterium]
MRASDHLTILAAIAVAALLVASPRAGLADKKDGKIWKEPAQEGSPLQVAVPSFAPLGQALKPTVVSIWVTQTIDPENLDPMFKFFKEFFGSLPEDFKNKGEGSGVLINSSGYILTNNHVVQDATDIKVTLATGEEYEASIVGLDPATDVALIKIPAKGLAAAPLGDSDSLAVGDWVLAIGNPFGLEATMTAGIVSAMGRSHIGPVKDHKYQDFIQTDAPINPGSSGGPLFDLSGDVVGINTAINAAGQGIGFAIPINMVKALIPQLVEHGSVKRSWLGVSIQTLTAPLAKAFGLSGDGGALVSEVVDGSPADKAGIEIGDVILSFDGKTIDGIEALSWLASTAGEGTKAKIAVWRNKKKKTVQAVLEALPGEAGTVASKKKKKKKSTKAGKPGISVQSMDKDTAAKLSIQPVGSKFPGLIVTAITAGSPLSTAGIQRGDVILRVDGKLVFKASHVLNPVMKAKKGDVVVLYVVGPGQNGFAAYTP